jgi:hypothetical protein
LSGEARSAVTSGEVAAPWSLAPHSCGQISTPGLQLLKWYINRLTPFSAIAHKKEAGRF